MTNELKASGSTLRALSDALLAISVETTVERAFQKMVDAARELVDARYAALGIPDGEGGFAQFITSGISEEQMAAIGPLPRTHGLLGAMLEDAAPFMTADIQRDPRFWGWQKAHPDMRSFLGVPVVSGGCIIASFYLTEKLGGGQFTLEDQQLMEMLAAHAAIAIENTRLYERSRELSIVAERNRLAREMHDSLTQTLFSLQLTADAAGTLFDRDAAAARLRLGELRQMARDAALELRALIFELRQADFEADGLVATLRKHIDVLRRVRHAEITFDAPDDACALDANAQREVFRIAQEALNNALKHADAAAVTVALDAGPPVTLTVRDDGAGFNPRDARIRTRRLGLTSMRERAAAIGGALDIESAPGAGTTVRLRVPA